MELPNVMTSGMEANVISPQTPSGSFDSLISTSEFFHTIVNVSEMIFSMKVDDWK